MRAVPTILVVVSTVLGIACGESEPGGAGLRGQFRGDGADYYLLRLAGDGSGTAEFRVEPPAGTLDSVCGPTSPKCPTGTGCHAVQPGLYNIFGDRCLKRCTTNADCSEGECQAWQIPPAPPSDLMLCSTPRPVRAPTPIVVHRNEDDTFALALPATLSTEMFRICDSCRLVDHDRRIECQKAAPLSGWPTSCQFQRVSDDPAQ